MGGSPSDDERIIESANVVDLPLNPEPRGRVTPPAYFAYEAVNNMETVHIFLIFQCFTCNSVLFTALYAMWQVGRSPSPQPRILITLNSCTVLFCSKY